jgi:MFS family permease
MEEHLKKDLIIITISCLASLLQAYFGNITPIALPAMAKTFGLSNILQNWVTNIFLLTMGICAVPFSKLTGKYGVKKTFIISLILVLIGTIGTAISNSISLLFLSRIIQGIGGAGLCVNSMVIITDAISQENRGKAFGINLACVYIGIAMAPVLGGIITYNFGWNICFWSMVPVIIANLILLFFIKEENVKAAEDTFDWKGSIIFALAFASTIYGFSILNTINGIIFAILGLLLFLFFVKLELKTQYPIFDINLFKDSSFLWANIACMLSFLATFSVTVLINYNLQYIRGYNPETTGLIIIICPVMMAIFALLSGILSDKWNHQKVSAIGMIIATISLILLIPLNKYTPLYIIILSLFLQGVGMGIFATPNMNTIMSNVPEQDTPMASSAVATLRIIGQTGSMGVLTVIFAFFMGNVLIIPSNYPQLIISTQVNMVIVTIFAILTVLSTLIGYKLNH